MPVIVYEPESRLRHPLIFFEEMWQDLLGSRELAWQLLKRDIQSQYRQSILGIIWAFIPPLVAAAGLTFLRKTGVFNIGDTDIPYPVYVVFSMTLWQTFTQTINSIMSSARNAKSMLMKLKVPPEAFVIAQLGQIIFNFFIQLIPIIFFFIWFKIGVTWNLLLAPVAFIHLLMFATAIGLFAGPFSCLYGDVKKVISYTIRLWLFITPVIYPVPRESFWAILIKINPVTPLLVTTRDLATTGVVSQPLGFWIASVVSILSVILGWIFYRLAMPFIVERA
ncbi:MAG TPA: polysialic acid transporter [Cyanothece sp. UBA12306]|nr:polysialic acid transporter [Cyanothece sp. UBA12306]